MYSHRLFCALCGHQLGVSAARIPSIPERCTACGLTLSTVFNHDTRNAASDYYFAGGLGGQAGVKHPSFNLAEIVERFEACGIERVAERAGWTGDPRNRAWTDADECRRFIVRDFVQSIRGSIQNWMRYMQPVPEGERQSALATSARLVEELHCDVERDSDVHLLALLFGLRTEIGGMLHAINDGNFTTEDQLKPYGLNTLLLELLKLLEDHLDMIIVFTANRNPARFECVVQRVRVVYADLGDVSVWCAMAIWSVCGGAVFDGYAERVEIMITPA